MENIIERNYKNNRVLINKIREEYGTNYDFKVRCYTSDDNYEGKVYTDLEIDMYRYGQYQHSITYASVESSFDDKVGTSKDFWNLVDSQRKTLSSLKKKLFTYLSNNLNSVECGEDYTQ